MAVKKGFSVIELVVVIGLISLLSIGMSAILLTTIVSSNRVRTMTKIKQAGDYTITQIQTMIRNARTITPCSSVDNTMTIIGQDGGSSNIAIENDRIASSSGIFLTPEDLTTSAFNITCAPSDDTPAAITISFDLENTQTSGPATQNPKLHFETTAQIRND